MEYRLRVQTQGIADAHGGKEGVAQLFGHIGSVNHGLPQLHGLRSQLVDGLEPVVPGKARLGSLFHQFFGPPVGREILGYRFQGVGEGLLVLFHPLDGVPVVEHLAGAAHHGGAEDVGMTQNQLLADAVVDVLQSKPPGVLLHVAMEYHLG